MSDDSALHGKFSKQPTREHVELAEWHLVALRELDALRAEMASLRAEVARLLEELAEAEERI